MPITKDEKQAICSSQDFVKAIKYGNLDFLKNKYYPVSYFFRLIKFNSLVDGPAGLYAIHLAVYFGHPAVFKYLIEQGAEHAVEHGGSLNSGDQEGFTPLCWAAIRNQPSIARYILSMDSKAANFIHPENHDKTTPLHLAARRGDQKMAELLLKHGANIAAQDELGNTPLHDAYINGQPNLASFLKTHGAVDTIRNQTNQYAVMGLSEVRASSALHKMHDGYDPYIPPYISPCSTGVGFVKPITLTITTEKVTSPAMRPFRP